MVRGIAIHLHIFERFRQADSFAFITIIWRREEDQFVSPKCRMWWPILRSMLFWWPMAWIRIKPSSPSLLPFCLRSVPMRRYRRTKTRRKRKKIDQEDASILRCELSFPDEPNLHNSVPDGLRRTQGTEQYLLRYRVVGWIGQSGNGLPTTSPLLPEICTDT